MRHHLRPYQVEAVEAVFREWEKVRSTMIVLPTGCGKTITIAEIFKRVCDKNQKAMFIA